MKVTVPTQPESSRMPFPLSFQEWETIGWSWALGILAATREREERPCQSSHQCGKSHCDLLQCRVLENRWAGCKTREKGKIQTADLEGEFQTAFIVYEETRFLYFTDRFGGWKSQEHSPGLTGEGLLGSSWHGRGNTCQARQRECAISGLSSSSSKTTRIIMKAPHSWPHLTLTTSQRPCLKNVTLNFSTKCLTHTHCRDTALWELTDWWNARAPQKAFGALIGSPSPFIGHNQ